MAEIKYIEDVTASDVPEKADPGWKRQPADYVRQFEIGVRVSAGASKAKMAVHNAIIIKDTLKARGYRYDPAFRAWERDVTKDEKAVDAELQVVAEIANAAGKTLWVLE